MKLDRKSAVLLSLAAMLSLASCSNKEDERFKDVDNNGVPLEKGKAQCKVEAKAEAQGVAKGDVTNGVADDLYTDCLYRRGYFKE